MDWGFESPLRHISSDIYNVDMLEKVVFITKPKREKLFFTKPKIGINFVPNAQCTNNCLFCKPNIPAMKKLLRTDVTINKEYSNDRIVEDILKIYKKNKNCSEVVITGTIGEPLLFFDKLVDIISKIKEKIKLPVRLNTNGQIETASNLKSKNGAILLEKSGLDSVAISLNAINSKDYNFICQPRNKNIFNEVVKFIRACNKIKIKTFISFVDYSKSNKYNKLPQIDIQSIEKFAKNIGLKKEQILLRPIIE